MDRHIYDKGILAIGDRNPRRIPRGNSTTVADVPGGGTPLGANPAPIDLLFSNSQVAPHAVTVRFSYTVPVARRAKIETALIDVHREGAGGVVGAWGADIYVLRKGGVNKLLLARVTGTENTLPAARSMVNPGPIELFAGDTVECTTIDGTGGGGVLAFNCSVLGTEFDAVVNVDKPHSDGSVSNASSSISGASSGSGSGATSGGPVLGYIGTGGINSGIPIK